MARRTAAAAFAAMMLIFATAAEAARPDLRRMTCAEAQQLVARHGAVVMTTGPHTYFRFVANQGYCDPWEAIFVKYSPTRDTPQCPVGYECREPLFRPFRWDD